MLTESEDITERAAKLRAQAKRYRALAEFLSDQKSIAIAQECASELEAEAAAEGANEVRELQRAS
ncbi:MAG TPA: hypothetical protein VNH44_04815 [Micropepsaceae bacterium]|nr:hypothetical protein [Micropepsaceae bacterium]